MYSVLHEIEKQNTKSIQNVIQIFEYRKKEYRYASKCIRFQAKSEKRIQMQI